jgi:4-diphosphocytidyl-2-C-methyl-D-erythritol kinase
MPSITLRAFAKINLSLRVKGVRPDGFHDVQTILQAIDLFDRVRCEKRRGAFAVRCAAAGVPAGRGNIVWKAAQELWTAAGRAGEPRDTVVTIEKQIPVQAGLGGGSSDAAAALVGLRRLWKARVDDERMYEIAAGLGSDVPYFLIGGTAIGLGRGEEVYPLVDLPRLWVVLAMPSFGVATSDAYAWLHTGEGSRLPAPEKGSRLQAPGFWPDTLPHAGRPPGAGSRQPFLPAPLGNDLEPGVIDRHPLIGQLKERLSEMGADYAAMSGSGSAVFGVFSSSAAAASAARRLKRSGVDALHARFRPRPRP